MRCWFFFGLNMSFKINREELVELGFAFRPHGIKGGFLFKLLNEQDSVLARDEVIYIFPSDPKSTVKTEGERVEIENIHFGNKVICYLKDIKDRNLVESMLPFKIFYPRDKFPKLCEDEWYVEDLVGLKVFNLDGYEIGLVDAHYNNGVQTILKVKLVKDNEFVELPFVENFFPKVDIENQRITMIEPEYD